MRKFLIYMCSALMICGSNAAAYFGGYSAYDLYLMASNGNFRSLYDVTHNGGSINVEDSNGQSAICYAIINSDFTAYKNLTAMNANEHPRCVNDIPKQDYENFKRGYELRGGHISSSFGISGISGSAVAWTVAGVAAVGAGVAVAAGGGGGGGGSDSSSSGSSGSSDAPTPTPETCESFSLLSCPSNGTCLECIGADRSYFKLTGCKSGYKLNDWKTGCIVDSTLTEEYPLTECDLNGECTSTMSGNVKMYKLVSCKSGYKISSDRLSCEVICPGYTKEECNLNGEYISAYCTDDASYHICTTRQNTDHCSAFEKTADLCTQCYGRYKLKNGSCEQMCKDLTQTPCNNTTQYTTDVCADDPNYHRCVTRNNTTGCSEFETDKDLCKGCQGGYTLKNGVCEKICAGYTQDSCAETQYISAYCVSDTSYHICTNRLNVEGCMLFKQNADRCTSCYSGYKFNSTKGSCDPICSGYTKQQCNKGTQYISEYCTDDNNFHKCATRLNIEGCLDFVVDKDVCTGCAAGYELNGDACKSLCPGYTNEACEKLEYISETCSLDSSFHKCSPRANTNACAEYDGNNDWCTKCEDGYELINHVCSFKCPGYTNVKCNISKEYETSDYCSKDSAYHKCSVRTNIIGCTEFNEKSDTCAKCNGTSEIPVKGICECKGYITDECDNNTQYISAECATAAGYHVCTERENTEGCKGYATHSDTCTVCEKDDYYLKLGTDGYSGICTWRDYKEGCKQVYLYDDKCTECENEGYYLKKDEDKYYGRCTPREYSKETEGCMVKDPTSDTCIECRDKTTYYYDTEKHICVVRKNNDDCSVVEDNYDTCLSCKDITKSFLDLSKGENPTTKDGWCTDREHADGCLTFETNTDTCLSCESKSEYYLDVTQGKNNKGTGGTHTDGWCRRRTTENCTNYMANSDYCTACEDGYYLKKVANQSYGTCEKRQNDDGCLIPTLDADTCEKCSDYMEYYLPTTGDNKKICQKRKYGTGCLVPDENADTCKRCTDYEQYYLPTTGDVGVKYVCQSRSNKTGCDGYEVNLNKCNKCQDGYYLMQDAGQSYGDCKIRQHTDGCIAVYETDDTCTQCVLNTHYLNVSLDENGKPKTDNGECVERTNTANCLTFDKYTDKCLTCTGYDYKVDNGFCIQICQGYIKEACDIETHYTQSDCDDETSINENLRQYHKCVKRTNFAGCSRFSPNSDECTACKDGYTWKATKTVNNAVVNYGHCEDNYGLCSGYTQDECFWDSMYMPLTEEDGKQPYCEVDPSYHRCVTRKENLNCAEFDHHTDRCTRCPEGYGEPVEGVCTKICDGYYTEDCPDGYYIDGTCKDNSLYHTCKQRENSLEHCVVPATHEDKCENCESDYIWSADQKKCIYACPAEEGSAYVPEGECDTNNGYYKDKRCVNDPTKVLCIPRTNIVGCTAFDPEADKCTDCDKENGYKLVDGKCVQQCVGKYTTEPCTNDQYASECTFEPKLHICTARTYNDTHCLEYMSNADKCQTCEKPYKVGTTGDNIGKCENKCGPESNGTYMETQTCPDGYYNKDGKTCQDFPEYRLCVARTILEGCTQFNLQEDKCKACDEENLYKLNETNGKCEKKCVGYTNEPCLSSQYVSDTCKEFPEYHKCTDRTADPYCVKYNDVKDECEVCEKRYLYDSEQKHCVNQCVDKGNEGTYMEAQVCPDGYYNPDGNRCEAFPDYVLCKARTVLEGCTEFDPIADKCKACDEDNRYQLENGKCVQKCIGYTDEPCLSSEYVSETCTAFPEFHKCAARTADPHCVKYSDVKNECEICEKRYLVGGNEATGRYCVNQCVDSAAGTYIEVQVCPDGYYNPNGATCSAFPEYRLCKYRTHMNHCTEYSATEDKCTSCDEGYEPKNSGCSQICPGYYKECPTGFHPTGEICSEEHPDYLKCEKDGDANIAHCTSFSDDKKKCLSCEDWYTLGSGGTACNVCTKQVKNCVEPFTNSCECQYCIDGMKVNASGECEVDPKLVPGSGSSSDSSSDSGSANAVACGSTADDWCDADCICNKKHKLDSLIHNCKVMGKDIQCEQYYKYVYGTDAEPDEYCPSVEQSQSIVGKRCGCQEGYLMYDAYFAEYKHVRRHKKTTNIDDLVSHPIFSCCKADELTIVKDSDLPEAEFSVGVLVGKCKSHSGGSSSGSTGECKKDGEHTCSTGTHQYKGNCETGYHKCKDDIEHCKTYNTEDGDCKECEDNYNLDNGKCVEEDVCDGTLVKYWTDCFVNDGDDMTTRRLHYVSGSECKNADGEEGYFSCKDRGTNIPNCKNYKAFVENQCEVCETGYDLNSDNTECIKNGSGSGDDDCLPEGEICTPGCDTGHQYKVSTDECASGYKCGSVIPGCIEYSSDQTTCLTCDDNYKVDSDGKCKPDDSDYPYYSEDACDKSGKGDYSTHYVASMEYSVSTHGCTESQNVYKCIERGYHDGHCAKYPKYEEYGCDVCNEGFNKIDGPNGYPICEDPSSGSGSTAQTILQPGCVTYASNGECAVCDTDFDMKNEDGQLIIGGTGYCVRKNENYQCTTLSDCYNSYNSIDPKWQSHTMILKGFSPKLYSAYCGSDGDYGNDVICANWRESIPNCVEYNIGTTWCSVCKGGESDCTGVAVYNGKPVGDPDRKFDHCSANEYGICDVKGVAPSTSSSKVVQVHEVSEGMTKGITKFVAKSSTLENFNDEITAYNGKTGDVTQKIAVAGKFNNTVDITGAVNVHNGSEDGGVGNIEIFSDGTAENVKGAVKGLVGGNNYEGSSVAINLDVKDDVQNGKRSFIVGMGKEVGSYQSGNKEELDGVDLGSAAYGQHNRTLTNAGNISIDSKGDAPVFAMIGLRHADNVKDHSENQNLGDFENTATGVINVNAPNAAEVHGIKVNNLINETGLGSEYSNIVNEGTINVSGGSNVYGISAKNASVYNKGDINVSASGDNAYGIYADKSKVENTGNINIDAAKAANAYGIYATGGSTVKNEGTITINNDKSTDNVADGKFIYTDKSSYVLNSGTIFSDAALNTSSLGGANLLMSTGANITAPEVSGTLNLSSDVTTGSNANVYVMQNLVNGNTANLDVLSQSAMFSAALNDYGSTSDAVLTRNSFNSLMSNTSLADYLERNYAAGKGTELFDELKKQTSLNDLNDGIGDFFGQRLPKMTFEDMTIMREVNFDMSKKMFDLDGAFEFGGNVAPYGYSDTVNSTGRYALYGFNYGKKSYGLGVAISDVNSYDDEKADSRSDTGVVVSTPLARKVNGFEFITTPQLGYAYGEYNRAGFNNSYKGKVYKRMYALMNEVRYPVNLGKMKFTPVIEFNMIGFKVKGSEEAHKPFNLRIPSQTHYSVEAGTGFMLEKAFSLYKVHRFKFDAGLAFYHEFANPYELDIRMSDLDGTYRLHDEKRHSNRVAARFGFDYEMGNDIDVSMSVLSNIDGECRTDAVCDIKYHF